MNLYVSNLNHETTESDLRRVFSEFGEVVSAKVIKDLVTGEPRGFGFVEMGDKNAATDAIDNLDATFLQGNIIVVKPAKQNPAKGGPAPFRKPFPRRNFDSGTSGNYGDTDNFNRF